MSEKLKDYQVLDVLYGGTFYKVRHKVTNNIFAWKACNCSTYSDEQIKTIVNEVNIIGRVKSRNLLRYYDTILHAPSKTLYFVLEYNTWQSVEELIVISKANNKPIAEKFIWYLILELARVCKVVEGLNLLVIRKCITPVSIFVGENCELRVNCFDLDSLTPSSTHAGLMRQAGDVVHSLCYLAGVTEDVMKEFQYSDDLRDVVSFLVDDRSTDVRPDVILYHPTVLANSETSTSLHISEILLSLEYSKAASEVNKCDSEKAVELCRIVEPAPRTHVNIMDSPIYSNISPQMRSCGKFRDVNSSHNSLSPTLAALALELPGYVPRSRKPYTETVDAYNPQKISEETLSQQWMNRLIALREREDSLNKRERDLIAKEIVSSPTTKVIHLNESLDTGDCSNGITLPPVITQAAKAQWISRRRHHRASSVRSKGRRKSYAYEDLDSSLSADAGDGSIIVTSKKITRENMPRRNIFSDVSTKKVHFTSSNPFAESDESVTLTFYELDNVDKEGYQVPRQHEKVLKDITQFKYLDTEKVSTEKRSAVQQWESSPSKQPRTTKHIFSGFKNQNYLKKTPSKSTLMSKGSNTSRHSMIPTRTNWSSESGSVEVSGSNISEAAHMNLIQTPCVLSDTRKSKRKSLLPFKTPFKFMTSTKM